MLEVPDGEVEGYIRGHTSRVSDIRSTRRRWRKEERTGSQENPRGGESRERKHVTRSFRKETEGVFLSLSAGNGNESTSCSSLRASARRV